MQPDTRMGPAARFPILALLMVLVAIPSSCLGLLLTQNEYAAMDHQPAPPDCDISAADPFLLAGFVTSAAVVSCFGRRAAKELGSALLLVLVALAILVSIGVRAPSYLRERALAERLCSP